MINVFKGKQHYLYYAIDSNGYILYLYLQKHPYIIVAYAFMKQLIRYYGEPRAPVIGKCTASIAAVNKLKNEGLLNSVDGVPSAQGEFVSIRDLFRNFIVILSNRNHFDQCRKRPFMVLLNT